MTAGAARARLQLVMARQHAPSFAALWALAVASCVGTVDGEGGAVPPGGTSAPPVVGPDGTVVPANPTPGGAASPELPAHCRDRKVTPARTGLRRLTRFEYDNTVRDLLGDTTAPAQALPAEEAGNGFGNDAAAQAVSSLLAEQYATVAEGIAARATATPAALGKLAPCAATGNEDTCARTFIEGFAPRAFRRALAAGEADALFALYRSSRMLEGASFATAVAAVLEAVLQSPEFLYRVELGVADRTRAGGKRPTGEEMATRLSYLLWGTMPDEELRQAARTGGLDKPEGVLAQATRMLRDPRTRRTVRFFFDNLLPISGLSDLERDPMLYPSYTATVGALMQEETQRFLEHELFEGSGTFAGALTAPYTFVNGPLAGFYKLPGVSGAAFQKVPLDPGKRRGFLTAAGVMAGTTHSNHTNPVVRGAFVATKLLCIDIPLPDASIAEKVKPPDPYTGKTARERFTKHQEDPVCKGCHALMDPLGFAFENYDAVGLHRTHENGVLIDASGGIPGQAGTVEGPTALVQKLAGVDAVNTCFARHWLQFAYGKSLAGEGPAAAGDQCLQAAVNIAFRKAGYDVRQLLLALTQTDDFLSLSEGP